VSADTPRLSPPEFLQLVADPQRWQLLTSLAQDPDGNLIEPLKPAGC